MNRRKRNRKFSKAVSLLLSAAMLTGSLSYGTSLTVRAENSGEVGEGETIRAEYMDFVQDELVAEFVFGKEGKTQGLEGTLNAKITSGSVYNARKGYGFMDVEYAEEAAGWVNSVYYPREISTYKSGAYYVEDAADYVTVSSKVWTETESSGYGVFTYENTSEFVFDTASADYRIEVTFVNPTKKAYTAQLQAEEITRWDAEDSERSTEFEVAAGAEKKVTFNACVYDGDLNLRFLAKSGATSCEAAACQKVYVSKISVTRKATETEGEKPTIFLAGDSTVQSYTDYYTPQTGWGQVLYSYFGEAVSDALDVPIEGAVRSETKSYETENVIVNNYALGGRSSKSYVQEGLLDDLLEEIKPGDYLFVQFGHNDATAVRPNRYVSPEDFEEWIMVYVNGALQRGAVPVLVTPCARYSYTTDAEGGFLSFKGDFEEYGDVMRSVAKKYDIPLIDLTRRSIEECNCYGLDADSAIFLYADAGIYSGKYANGVQDNTHLSNSGAIAFAGCVANGIAESTNAKLDALQELLTLELEPSQPQNLVCVSPKMGQLEDDGCIDLTWDAMENVTKYKVYVDQVGSGVETYTVTEAELHLTDMDLSWEYECRVEAENEYGTSIASAMCVIPALGGYVSGSREEYTDRAAVAMDLSGADGGETYVTATDAEGNEYESGVYMNWRSYEADLDENNRLTTSFTVYKNGGVLAENLKTTNLIDPEGSASDVYQVKGSNDETLGITAKDIKPWSNKYLELQLFAPADQDMPDGTTAVYHANDMSLGDLDGDGVLELVVKWYPNNAQDNSKNGYTGTTILDGYDIDYNTGAVNLLWRIDMGVNIRSGAHYTQFQVWDYDGDGKAELAVKTSEGTTSYVSLDGTDNTLLEVDHVGEYSAEQLPTATITTGHDYRTEYGRIYGEPEKFTIFNCDDGTIVDSVDYTPVRGNYIDWGKDDGGNRSERYLSATAYLNGATPFAVFCRGYYHRTALTAYYLQDTDNDGIGDTIATYWAFDTDNEENGSSLEGQGNHGISVNDVDGDGRDEIIYGAIVMDDDGTVLYCTGLGHGDAQHTSDWVSWNDGLEIMSVHEHVEAEYHVEVRDAASGQILMGYYVGSDTGRGVMDDIDPTSEGAEWWSIASPGNGENSDNEEPSWDSTNGEVYSSWSTTDNLIKLSDSNPAANATILWDGDLLAEIQDHTFNEADYVPIGVALYKWDYANDTQEKLFYSEEVYSNNGTKGNLGLCADFLGDWREEMIVRSASDGNKVRIYSTTIETDYVVPCLLQDRAYREGVAWQNVAYNQPANTSYLVSQGVVTAQLSVGDLSKFTKNSVAFNFTPANDGDLFGLDIVGYNIYRASGEEEYSLLDTVNAAEAEDGYLYVDKTVEAGKSYSYKVAAVVERPNGGTAESYLSRAITLEPSVELTTAPVFEKQTLVQDAPLKEGWTVADLLPTTVMVKDAEGNDAELDVTWDVSDVDITEVGEYTAKATVKGWSETIDVTVEVVENYVVSFDAVSVSTRIFTAPVMPETVVVNYANGNRQMRTVTWDLSTLNYNTIGDKEVQGTVEGVDAFVTCTVSVKAKPAYTKYTFGSAHNVIKAFNTNALAETAIGTTGFKISTNTTNWNNVSINSYSEYESGYYPYKKGLPDNGYYLFVGSGGNSGVTATLTLPKTVSAGSEIKITFAKPSGTNNGSKDRGAANDVNTITIGTEMLDLQNSYSFNEWKTVSVTSDTDVTQIVFGLGKWSSVAVAAIEIEDPDAAVEATGVTLDKTTLTLKEGDTETLTATVAPTDTTDATVMWSSSDNSVATVENGIVTAVSEGNATITVTTTNGKTAECQVTVKKATDKTALNAAIEAAEALEETDYTKESWTALAAALAAAKETAEDEDATQADADAAKEALDKAVEALEEAKEIVVSDLSDSHWSYSFVVDAIKKGIMAGVAADENGAIIFAPEENLTREQLAQILYNVELAENGTVTVESENPFSDVDEDEWYAEAVIWAAENEIVSGYPDGTFGVGLEINRREVATMLYNYASYKGYDVSQTADMSQFVDAEEMEWSAPFMTWAVGAEVMSGEAGGYLRPLNPADRATAATMVMNFLTSYAE